MSEQEIPRGRFAGRLITFYLIIAAITVAVVVIVVNQGQSEKAQPKPAGPSFNIQQSGQFVNIGNTQGTLSSQLRLGAAKVAGGHRLTGTVDCVSGRKSLRIDAIATGGAKGGR